MGRKHHGVLVAGVVAVALAAARPAAGMLTDMVGHWSAPLVGALEAHGIISGDDQGRFNPDAPLTRAELAKLFVTGLGYQDEAKLLAGYPSRFSDVPSWHWAKGYIESLAETAAVDGYPDGTFLPGDTVTRAQVAAILVRSMGLSEQARLARFEVTGYQDDVTVPDWARGYVNVAKRTGLMDGFEDGTFRPNQSVTRAEGSTALFRYLTQKGRVFNLEGTLVRFDPVTLQGTVRDELGQEQTFTMAKDARYFRGGVPAVIAQVRPLDQVWVVIGADGLATFMDAHYKDLLAADPSVFDHSVTVTAADGVKRTLALQQGAFAFLNGKAVSPDQVNGAQVAYMVLDSESGEVRVLDAVAASVRGKLAGANILKATIYVQTDHELKQLSLASDITVLLNGQRAQPADLQLGDSVMVAVNDAGAAVYVVAER